MKQVNSFLIKTIVLLVVGIGIATLIHNMKEEIKTFRPGECIGHVSSDKVDFYIHSYDENRKSYQLITHEGDELKVFVSNFPEYSQAQYLEKFYKKQPCLLPEVMNFENVKLGMDPLETLRTILMKSDLSQN